MPTKPLPDPIAKVVNKYGDPDAFAERDLELLSDRLQHLPFGTLLYPGDAARLLQDKDAALKEWMDKTEWVQEQKSTFPVKTVGLHRADVLREEIQRLRAVLSSVPVPSGSRYNFLIGDDGEYQVMDSKGQQVGTLLYYQDAKHIAAALTPSKATVPTVTLTGHQLKEALEYLNPDGLLDPTQEMLTALYHDGYAEMLEAAPAPPLAPVQKGGIILQARSPEQTSWEDVTKEVYDHALANGFEVRTLKLEVL